MRDGVVYKVDFFQLVLLFAALISTLVNQFYVTPKATQVMFQRHKMEKEKGQMAEASNDPVCDYSGCMTPC